MTSSSSPSVEGHCSDCGDISKGFIQRSSPWSELDGRSGGGGGGGSPHHPNNNTTTLKQLILHKSFYQLNVSNVFNGGGGSWKGTGWNSCSLCRKMYKGNSISLFSPIKEED